MSHDDPSALSHEEVEIPNSFGSNHSHIDVESNGSSTSLHFDKTRVARAPSFYPRSAGGTGSETAVDGRHHSTSTRQRSNSIRYATEEPVNAPVVLVWKDLSVRTKTGATQKVLLNRISGQITGGFWAIMGASGSGMFSSISPSLHLPLSPTLSLTCLTTFPLDAHVPQGKPPF
jgi:hypothetical protein